VIRPPVKVAAPSPRPALAVRPLRPTPPSAARPTSRATALRSEARPPQAADADWADGRLDAAVAAVDAGHYEGALAAIEEVLVKMQGTPSAIDAARGLDAIKRLLQLRFLDPEGAVAKASKRMAFEDMWGTRWATWFQ